MTICIFACSILTFEKVGCLAAVALSIIVLVKIDSDPTQAERQRQLLRYQTRSRRAFHHRILRCAVSVFRFAIRRQHADGLCQLSRHGALALHNYFIGHLRGAFFRSHAAANSHRDLLHSDFCLLGDCQSAWLASSTRHRRPLLPEVV